MTDVLMLEDALANPKLLEPPAAEIPRLVYRQRLTAIGSEPKLGKSTFIGQATVDYVTGRPFLDEPLCAGTAVWVGLDEGLGDVVRRLAGFGATRGVALLHERPGLVELEQIITDKKAGVLVIDTVTELAAGIVLDGNAQQQWQPIYQALRGIARRTDCGIILIDHTPKSNGNTLIGSTQKEAGCDLILTMTRGQDSPNVRKVKVRGRVPGSDFTIAWDGERYTLHTGELSTETRVFHFIAATPDCSHNAVRTGVVGRAKDIDVAVHALLARRLIQDHGLNGCRAYRVRPLHQAEGPGHTWDIPRDTPPENCVSARGTYPDTLGTHYGTTPVSRDPMCPGDTVGEFRLSDDELERMGIEQEQGL